MLGLSEIVSNGVAATKTDNDLSSCFDEKQAVALT